jgi:hypothetical protein
MTAFRGATVAATAATEAQTAAEVTAEAAGAPLYLIVLAVVAAIAALVAIGYVLYRNWSTIWGAMKAIAKDVWDWIVGNWPYLLGVLLGPVGLAAALIYRHFSDIKGYVADAVHFIEGIWFGFVGFFAGINIGRIASGMWNGIKDAFRDVLNAIVDLWNQFHFTLPHIHTFLGDLGGETIGVPQLPHFAAGGIVTAPTLAVLGERGPEAVVPLSGRGRPGPAVHIDNVNLHDGADIGLLLSQIHFATMAGRL